MFHKVKKHLNSIKKYRLTSGTFIRLAVLACAILAIVFAGKLRSIFDHSIGTDLLANDISNSNITRSFFALPAYGVSKTSGQFQFENENDSVRINLSQNYSGPIEIKLSDSQSVRIFDQNGSDFKSDMLKSMDVSKNEEQNKYIKYESKDKRKIVYYSYQKDAKNGQKKLKNWIVYKSGSGKEKESYKIENAILASYQNGAVAVYYSDKFTDEKKLNGGEKKAVPPDLLIDRPYYFDKDGKIIDLDWKINQEKNEISLEFAIDKNSYPITLDPTITHNSKSQFDAGTALNRIESASGPKVQNAYCELPADENTVGLWHMNETVDDSCSGGKDVCDLSGNGNHGTASGTTIETTNQRLGTADRSFNGGGDYISAGTNFVIGTVPFSMEAWMKPGTHTNYGMGVYMGGASSGAAAYLGYVTTATSGISNSIGGGIYGASTDLGSGIVPDNNWHHVALTFTGGSGGVIKLYVDGIEKVSTTATPSLASTSVMMGKANSGTAYWYNGSIDEVRLSNIARTPEEIKADAQRFPYAVYNSSVMDLGVGATTLSKINWTENGVATGDGETPKDDTGLLAQWDFNETSGTAAINYIGAGVTYPATGGTITYSGGYRIHTFTTSGTFTANSAMDVEVLVIGGGGGGANSGAGGGAGGYVYNSSFAVTAQAYSVTVGNGGSGGSTAGYPGQKGQNSVFSTITAEGGGYGPASPGGGNGGNGGSGGGGDIYYSGSPSSGGTGSQGNNGGAGYIEASLIGCAGGGGGAGVAGTAGGNVSGSGKGGDGLANSISGSSVYYAGGGGGGEYNGGYAGVGGNGGGGSAVFNNAGTNGTANTGGGGGGGSYFSSTSYNGGNGGSGIVIIRYLYSGPSGCGSACNGTLNNFYGTSGQDVGSTAPDGWTSNNRRWGAGALMFDGVNDYITTGSYDNTGNAAMSVEAWIKTNSTALNMIFQSNGIMLYIGRFTAGKVFAGFDGSSTGNSASNESVSTVNDGQWHHIVGTNNGTITKIYVDGKLENSYSDTLLIAPSQIYIGSNSGTANFYNGVLDSTRIYSRALSDDEILSNYNAGNIDIQTRTGTTTNPDDGTWETWKPAGTETQIASMDSDVGNWSWDNTATYIPATTANESNIKIEGTGSMKIQAGAPKTDANTVGLWHLDETNTGIGSTVYDASGNANHGILLGTAPGPNLTEGMSGKARNFNGSSDYISAGTNSITGTSAFSIEAWMKPGAHSNYGIGPYIGNASSGASAYIGYVTTAQAGTSNSIGGGFYGSNYGSGIVPDNNWHHVALTFAGGSGGTAKLYVDGIEKVSTTTTPNLASTSVMMGKANSGTEYWYKGLIDEVRVSNVARSADEIAESYRAGRDHRISRAISSTDLSVKNKIPFYVAADRPGTYLEATIGESAFANYEPDANTMGFWHLEEQSGSGAYIKDSSGNGNNITLGTGSSIPTFAQGKTGKARSFDGNDYINAGSASTLSPSTGYLTISSWFKTSTDGKYIVAKYNTGSPNQGYGLLVGQVVANKLGCWVGGSAWTTSSTSVTDGSWHYGVCTYDGSNVRVYVDGKLDGMQAQTASLSYAVNLYTGTYGGLLYFWNGTIDEVRVDDVARTPSEIRQAYEVGKRTHNITIDFAASLDSGNLISGTADTSFTINSQTYGAQNKGDNLYAGDKIIVKENYNGTEYMAQGTVASVNNSTGAVTVISWDSGSNAPSGGYTTGAVLFKWQREYWDIAGTLDDQINAITKLTLRQTDGNEGRTIYIDDFKSLDNYLTDPDASGNITSTLNRYFQYRSISSTTDRNVSPYLSNVSAIYTDPFQDKNVYKGRGNVEMRGNVKVH